MVAQTAKGHSVGVLLPREALARPTRQRGDAIFLTEAAAPNGCASVSSSSDAASFFASFFAGNFESA
jgi:hypothetical protein